MSELQDDINAIYTPELHLAVEASAIKNNLLSEPLHREVLAIIVGYGLLQEVAAGRAQIINIEKGELIFDKL